MDPGTAREPLVVADVLGGKDLALLFPGGREIIEPLEHFDPTEAAQGNAITRLSEGQSRLEHCIQQIRFVNDSNLSPRGLAPNRSNLNIKLGKTQSTSPCALSSQIVPNTWHENSSSFRELTLGSRSEWVRILNS